MLSKAMAALVCLLVVLTTSCTASTPDHLPISTPPSTPAPAITATTEATLTPPTATLPPTPVPPGILGPDDVGQVKLLHQYWLPVATAADVDPYEMDVSAIAFNSATRLLAVGGCSKPLEADLRSGNVYCNGEGSENPEGVPFLLILNADTASVVGIVPENKAGTTIADLAFTSDGSRLIYAVQPGRFAVWDISSQEVVSTLWQGDTSAPKIALSPDGKWIALKTVDQAEILDSTSGEVAAELPSYFRPQFSPDGGRVAVYSDNSFIIYDTSTWQELMRFGLPCDCVYALSPDLSLLATSERSPAESPPVLIWDTSTGDQLQSLEETQGSTAFLAFTPNGRMLWRVTARGDVMAWDTSSWLFLAKHIGGITPIFNLSSFQFTEDGRNYLMLSDLHLGLYGLP